MTNYFPTAGSMSQPTQRPEKEQQQRQQRALTNEGGRRKTQWEVVSLISSVVKTREKLIFLFLLKRGKSRRARLKGS